MMKFVALFALIAVASAVPSPLVATPLLAKLSPQPEAPANTEHATHVAAAVPIAQTIAYSAPIIAPAPITYAAGYALGYPTPIEAHSYRIAY
ncbi:unnamed protein product [Hermetia illucens]|uniref:Uncharacterized protein n=1 Tax=Hermetia illucens TaxID=343691 RepID=A0A7R8YRQ4_HERIL|nr:unnamed protein product [Hermetia illucens]